MANNENNLEKLKMLLSESERRINRLFEDKYNVESKAGVLIGFGAIFFTFKFALTGIISNYWYVPIIFFVISLILLIISLWPNKFGVGAKESEYDNLIKKSSVDIATHILKANRTVIQKNTKNLNIINWCYGIGAVLIIFSIFLSFILNGFNSENNTNQKVMMENNYYCSNKNEEEVKKGTEDDIDITPLSEDDIDVQKNDDSDKK